MEDEKNANEARAEGEADATAEGQAPVVSNSMAAFSDSLEQLTKSLEILYIINNASGRRIFRDKWQEVADYIFGSELTAFDMEGVHSEEQRARRSELEEEADMRRIDLKQTISVFVEKSVDAGSLQFDYVGSVIDKYGAGIAQHLYESGVIERVRPGIMAELEKAREVRVEYEATQGNSAAGIAPSPEPSLGHETEVAQEAEAFSEEPVPAVLSEGALLQMPEGVEPEQKSNTEQTQHIEGTQQTPESEGAQQQAQQMLPEGLADSPVSQDVESVAHSPEMPAEQPAEDIEARLSVEEKDLLSNKEAVIPAVELEGVPEVAPQLSQAQEEQSQQLEEPLPEDPLGHIKPIETPVPDSLVSETEPVQNVPPAGPDAPTDVVVKPPQEVSPAPQSQQEPSQIDEGKEQGLKLPELLNPGEAMVAQNVPGIDKMLAEGILQEGDLQGEEQSVQAQVVPAEEMPQAPKIPEEPAPLAESVPVQEVQPQKDEPAVMSEAPTGQETTDKTDAAPVLSLKEEELREDLSQALQSEPAQELQEEKKPELEPQVVPELPEEPVPQDLEPRQVVEPQMLQTQEAESVVEQRVTPDLPEPEPVEIQEPQPQIQPEITEAVVEVPQQEPVVPPVQEEQTPLSGTLAQQKEEPLPFVEPESEPKEILIKRRPAGDKTPDSDVPDILKYLSEQEEDGVEKDQVATETPPHPPQDEGNEDGKL